MVKCFSYWELLFLVIITIICAGFGIVFNNEYVGCLGIILFALMWFSKKESKGVN